MTRKDYELIAKGVRTAITVGRSWPDAPAGVETAVYVLASSLAFTIASANPNFDRAKFLAACKIEELNL